MKKFPCKILIHKRSLRNREIDGFTIFNEDSLTLTDGLNQLINILRGTSKYHLDFGFRRITLEVENGFKCTLTPQQLKNGVSQFEEIIRTMRDEFQEYDIKSKLKDDVIDDIKTNINDENKAITKELMKQLDQVSLKSERKSGNERIKNKKRNKRDWDNDDQQITTSIDTEKDIKRKKSNNHDDQNQPQEVISLRISKNNNNDDLYISYDEVLDFDIESYIIVKDLIPFVQNVSQFNRIIKKGMKNLGNTCYMNATLQALLCLKTFISDMVHPILLSNVNINTDGTYYALLNIIKENFSLKEKGDMPIEDKEQNENTIQPSKLKDAVFNQSNLFGDLDQQDAHEFFSTLLHCIEEDNMQYLNRLRKYQKKFYKDSDILFDDRMTLFCPSKRNFGGVIEKVLTCNECKYTSKSFEFFRGLSLEVIESNDNNNNSLGTKKMNINSMLEKYFESEEVEMKCDQCHHQINAVLMKKIVQLPRILSIHLKRFIIDSSNQKNIDYKKVYCPVEYGINIDIKQFCSKGKDIRSFIRYRNTFNDEFSMYLSLLNEIKNKSKKKTHQPLYYNEFDSKENDEEQYHYDSNTEEWEFEDQSDKEEWDEYVKAYREKDDPKYSSKFKLNNQFENDEIAPVDENDDQRPPKSYLYHLKSVIHHIGETATRGHYVTDVYDEKQNKWIHFNDSNVNEIDSSTALGEANQKTVYMLFYVNDLLL